MADTTGKQEVEKVIEANMGRLLLETVSNGDNVRGLGTPEKPFVVMIPDSFTKEMMGTLLQSMSGVLLESMRENGEDALTVCFKRVPEEKEDV